jgi:hypothetical protein
MTGERISDPTRRISMFDDSWAEEVILVMRMRMEVTSRRISLWKRMTAFQLKQRSIYFS